LRTLASYAELVDHGEFAAVGVLLADATFHRHRRVGDRRGAVEKMLRDNVIVYDDGNTANQARHHQHRIEVDEEAGTAVRAFVLHRATSLADLALQPIVSGS